MANKGAPGFAQFATFLASDLDLQIYRKFDHLSSRNLAYLQSELATIDAELAELDASDRKEAEARPNGWIDSGLPSRCWETQHSLAEEGNDTEQTRIDLMSRLRSLMTEYQEALLRQSRVLALESPPPRARNALFGWFQQEMPLYGDSITLFDDKYKNDVIALKPPEDQDRLTSFIQNRLGHYFQSTQHAQYTFSGVRYFPDQTIRHIVSGLSVIISAVLLVCAIVALEYAPSKKLKLGLLAILVTFFAASIALLTNARKVEIYAATAAYAAVLVVYVSNDPANCST